MERMISGQLPPRETDPRLGLEFGSRIGLVLGLGDNFPRGAIVLEPERT